MFFKYSPKSSPLDKPDAKEVHSLNVTVVKAVTVGPDNVLGDVESQPVPAVAAVFADKGLL